MCCNKNADTKQIHCIKRNEKKKSLYSANNLINAALLNLPTRRKLKNQTERSEKYGLSNNLFG